MDHKQNMEYKKFEVMSNRLIAPETNLIELSGQMSFSPGQFIQVSIPHVGEATFAPCSDSTQKNRFQICVRAVGNTTDRLTGVIPGDTVLARGPYGNSWPLGKLIGKNVIIIAGGLGIVPLRPLILELIRFHSEFKKIFILAGYKTPDHVLFQEDFKLWQKQFGYVKVAVEKSSRGFWGENCRITDLVESIKINPKNSIALMCGPEVMFPFCNKILFEKKLDKKNLFISFERRMECGIGICQHCNIGKFLVCKDGPVFRYDIIEKELEK